MLCSAVRKTCGVNVLKQCLRFTGVESIEKENSIQKKSMKSEKRIRRTKTEIKKYLTSAAHLLEIKDCIPQKYLTVKPVTDGLYLIDSKIAKDVAERLYPILKENTKEQMICETNAGLGFITTELLDKGVKLIRLYESCAELRQSLKEINNTYPGRIELFTKNFYYLPILDYLDKTDNGNRTGQLLKGIACRDWTDEPVMSVIGPMPNISFIWFMIKMLVFNGNIIKHGRIRFFPFISPIHYASLTSTPSSPKLTYRALGILFQLLFDIKFIESYPRKAFIPWEQAKLAKYPPKFLADELYLVEVCWKKELPVPTDQLLNLYYFIRKFIRTGGKRVIPTIEQLLPGCGLNVFLPQQQHSIKYSTDIDIYTQFGQITPQEILCIFKEVINHPAYEDCPFHTMVETHLVNNETVETDMVISDSETSRNTDAEIMEEKLT